MKKIIDFLDSLDFSPTTMALTIFGLATIRLFLENFSSPEAGGLFAPVVGIISYASLYGMLLILFTITLSLLTKKNTLWSARVMTFLFPIVILTPIIDLIASRGVGHCIGYVQPGGQNMFQLFINFLLPHAQQCGITPGLRIQIIAGSLGLGLIVWLFSKSWIKSLLGIMLAYTISFIGGALPIIVNLITRSDSSHTFYSDALSSLLATIHYPSSSLFFTIIPSVITTTLLARIQFLLAIIGFGFIWYLGSRTTWRAWWLGSWKKIPIAGIHFVLLVFGFSLGFAVGKPMLIWPDIVGIATVLVSLFFACWSVAVPNDINDIEIDRISNPERPLIKYKMEVGTIRTIQYISGIFSIGLAILVNYNVAYCIGVFIILYMIHSSGIRLKRFWFTSSILITLSSITAFLTGYFTLSTDQIASHIPLSIILVLILMIIPYTLIKDIPDIAGDSSQNIQTFAALYGKNKTLVLVLAIILTWLILFISIIPWFFALGVIIPIIFFTIKPKLIDQKIWLLGLPVGIWFFGVLIHILIIK